MLTTLCYIEQKDSYLMLHRIKKEKDINKDKWIGVGGKFLPGESPEECLLREVKEETGLVLLSYQLRGILTFCCDVQKPEYIFLYTANEFSGDLKECEEGELQWVKKGEIEKLNLWEGDKTMFRLLEERKEVFSLKLVYEKDQLMDIKEWL